MSVVILHSMYDGFRPFSYLFLRSHILVFPMTQELVLFQSEIKIFES